MKLKKSSFFVAIVLTFFVVLGSFGSSAAFAFEKKDINFEQVRTEIALDNSGATLNKINSISNKSLEEKIGLEKSKQIEEEKKDYVEGEILVKYKNNKINLQTVSGRATALNFVKNKSLEKKEDLRKNNISVLRIKDNKTVEQKILELKNDPNVEYVEPNYKRYPAVINTDDANRGLLWGLDNTGQTVNTVTGSNDADIDAPEAWAINEGTNASVVVAVIDTGVAYNHPDLLTNMWDGTSCKDESGNALSGCNHGYDYEDNDKTPFPTSDSHGTHIAGIIAAVKNNSKGIIGVAPQAKIMAIKSSLTVSNIIKGINFAIQNGAKVINASYGDNTFSQIEYDAINSFKTAGGIFVAAAGNHSTNNDGSTHFYPSDYNLDNIISVAATDQNDTLATFSNYGMTSVDVGAPGTNIYSAIADILILNETFGSVIPPGVPSDWIKSGTSNNWRTFNLGGSVGNVLYGDVSLPYASGTDTAVTSPTYNLDGSAATIDFFTTCDTEYITDGWADYMQLEYSSDGVNFSPASDPYFPGEFRWDEATFDILNKENPLNSTNGSSFHYENISIPAQYSTSNFKFRFRWVANDSDNNYDGCFVDDIKITKFTDGSDDKYDYYNGTSMAAPYVAGLAVLIEGYNPSLTFSQVKNAILNTGDSVTSLSDKTVSGKRINAQNALLSVNPAKAIIGFTILNQVGETIINENINTITVTVPFGTAVTALIPTIVITGASVNPASGVAQNFTSLVTYTVTAADGSTQDYVVTVTIAPNTDTTAPTLSSYTISETIISPNNDGIKDSSSIDIKYSEEVKAEINILDSSGVKVRDLYSSPAVTNPQAKVWNGKNNSNVVVPDGIYTIQILGTDLAGNILSDTSKTITVDIISPVIILNGVTPDITVGGSYTELGATATDTVDGTFSATPSGSVDTAVVGAYTITYSATDTVGNIATPVTRTVNVVSAPLSSAKAITSFSFPSGTGVINETAHTITATVPFGTNVTALVPTITITGISVSPVSGVAQDFTSPVTYTVTAENSFTQAYVVTVNFSANPDIALLAADKDALINDSIKGANSDLSNITGALATLPTTGSNGSTITWVSSNPSVVSNDGQTIIRPAFTASDATVTLTATLEKGSVTDTKIFTLIVLKLPASAIATITSESYTISANGAVAETITNVPFGVSKAEFLAALAKGEVNQVWDDAGITDPVTTGNTLVVTAQDDTTTKTYTLTVALNSAKAIVSFNFTTPSVIGVVNETAHTITITVPNATDITALVPTIVISTGSTISPVSNVAQNFTNPVTYIVTAANSATQTYVVSVIVATATQTVPTADGAATINNTTPQVIITNPTQANTITISSGTTAPTINVSSFISGGTGTLPAINITSANANNANVTIPTSTVVTSADNTWNGIIATPTTTTVTLPETSGQTKTLSTAIEVGFTGAKLSFDKAVRILLPNQAGKRAGYIRTGINFTEIINTCAADNQTTGDALTADGECKIDVGSDLVIWTKHFTSFATYTQTTTVVNNGGGGGGGGGGGNNFIPSVITPTIPIIPVAPLVPSISPRVILGCDNRTTGFSTTTGGSCIGNIGTTASTLTTQTVGQVLGASSFRFTLLMKKGSKGNEVMELQKFLNNAGYNVGTVDGKFGSKTKAAVIKLQLANKLKGDGVVGAMTRAVLNR